MEILDSDQEKKPSRFKIKHIIVFAVFALLSGMLVLVGSLFKVQSWEGGSELFTTGIVLLALSVMLAVRKLVSFKEPNSHSKK